MLALEVQGATAVCRYEVAGLDGLIKDLAVGIHAAACQAEQAFGGPAAREAVRICLLHTLADPEVWGINPESIQSLTEVDSPEELFETGGA